jgi:hypothetical protein
MQLIIAWSFLAPNPAGFVELLRSELLAQVEPDIYGDAACGQNAENDEEPDPTIACRLN